MKLIKSKAEYLPQQKGLEGIYKQIEFAARVCYKSENNIIDVLEVDISTLPLGITVNDVPDYKSNPEQAVSFCEKHGIKYKIISSAKDFVEKLYKNNHTAMLEHGTVYLMVHTINPKEWDSTIGRHKLATIDSCRDDLRTNPTYDKYGRKNWWAEEARHKAHVMAVKYADNPYSKVKIVLSQHEVNAEGGAILTPTEGTLAITKGSGKLISVFNTILISTNLRVLVENNWLDDLQYLCEPTTFHEKRLSVKVVTSIGIVRELLRHRKFSFANESTRYCNYSKERHGGEITFIMPKFWENVFGINTNNTYFCKLDNQAGVIVTNEKGEEVNFNFVRNKLLCSIIINLLETEYQYLLMTNYKFSGKFLYAQQAREILPLCTKSELVMTGFESDWRHFFDLRLFGKTGEPHPDMKHLAELIKEQFEINGLWDDIMKYPSEFE